MAPKATPKTTTKSTTLPTVSPPKDTRAAARKPKQNNEFGRLTKETVAEIFQCYAPDRLSSTDTTVDGLLISFKGHENDLIKSLVKVYGPIQGVPQNLGDPNLLQTVTALYEREAPQKVSGAVKLCEKYKEKDKALIAILSWKYAGSEKCRIHMVESLWKVDALLQKYEGAEVHLFAALEDRYGPHPTNLAAEHVMALAIRLSEGANVAAIDDKGNTLLHVAAEEGAVTNIQQLLDNGADLEALNAKDSRTPLQCTNQASIARLLLEYGAQTEHNL